MIPSRPIPRAALLLQALSLPVLGLPLLGLPAWAAPPAEPVAVAEPVALAEPTAEPTADLKSADLKTAEAALAPHAGAFVRAVEVILPDRAVGVAGLHGPVLVPAATGLAALVAERQAAGHLGDRIQASARAVTQGVALRVEVTEGPAARLGALRIEGNTQRKTSDLLAMLAAKVPGLKPGAPVVAEQVEAAAQGLSIDYVEAGWVAAMVDIEQTILEPGTAQTGPVVAVVLRVEEGPVTRVGAVRVALAEGETGAALGFKVPALALKHAAPFTPEAMRASAEAVAQAARAAGYAEVQVSPSVRMNPGGASLDLTLEVTPGPCCRATPPEPRSGPKPGPKSGPKSGPEPGPEPGVAARAEPNATAKSTPGGTGGGPADRLHLTVAGRRFPRLWIDDTDLLKHLVAAAAVRQPGAAPGGSLPAGDDPALLWIEVRSNAAPVATLEVVKTVLDAAGQPAGETRHRLLTTGAADADPQRCAEPQVGPRLAYGLWHDRDHTPNQPARYVVEATAAATCSPAGAPHTARAWTSPLGSGMTTAP